MSDNRWCIEILDPNEKKLGDLVKQINSIIINWPVPLSSDLYFSDADLVADQIWIGNYLASKNSDFIISNKIKNIINVTNDIPNKFSFVKYTTFPIMDIEACQQNF